MEQVIKQYVDIWNSKAFANLRKVFGEKAKYWDALQEGNAIELLSGSMVATHEAFSDLSFQIISLDSTGKDQFFLEWKMTGINTGEFFGVAPTGKAIEITGLDTIKVQESLITKIKSFYDSSLFSQQLGLD